MTILAASVMLSFHANAAQPSIEKAITEYVLSQGTQLMEELSSDLSTELTTSISNELSHFTITEKSLWLPGSNSTTISKANTINKKLNNSAE
jgi:hypothetical protein